MRRPGNSQQIMEVGMWNSECGIGAGNSHFRLLTSEFRIPNSEFHQVPKLLAYIQGGV